MVGRFIENDLSAVFRQSAFAETVVLDGVSITEAIFDDGDVEVNNGEGTTQIVSVPRVQIPTRSFANTTDQSTLVARGVTYRVANWKHDGTGVTEIFLEAT